MLKLLKEESDDIVEYTEGKFTRDIFLPRGKHDMYDAYYCY